MSSTLSAPRILPIGLVIAASACEFRTMTLTSPTGIPTGELALVVTSVSGIGVDPSRVRVEFHANPLHSPNGYRSGNAVGIATPITLRVYSGLYNVWASVSPLDYTRLGYGYICTTSVFSDTASVADNQRTVVQKAFACLQPGAAQVRTAVTGLAPGHKLRVQLAERAGICDLELSDDPYVLYYNLYRVFPVDHIGSMRQGPMSPGSYRMNLCGLPPNCPTIGASQAFTVTEDQVTDVLFTVRCSEATGGGAS